MSSAKAKYRIHAGSRHVRDRRPVAIALLLVPLLCLGLAACGGSSGGPPSAAVQAATRSVAAKPNQHELKEMRRLVGCIRQRGFSLSEPNASGKISTGKVNVHSHRYRSAVVSCLDKLTGKHRAGIFK